MQRKTADSADVRETIREVLGYLNFSSGSADPAFLKNLGELFARVDTSPAWEGLGALLRAELQGLRGSTDAFRQVEQAEAVLALVFEHALPAYRRYHRDLLFHQTDEPLFQPFFLGRTCQAVLQQGGPWNETERIVDGAVRRLNDYIGYRPVAVLETERKIQPYAHEWLRPVPLWIREAGAAPGPYCELVAGALEILEATEASLLFDAWFDPQQLDELAMDPRAYDFDHPVNKRPNYLFGQWDMHALDNSAQCRRFVVQQVALDAMLARLEDRGKVPYEELLFEESAVLAGTMLMGSGVSGNRPDAHDSDTSLPALVQHIAAYRDAFYERLLAGMKGPHAQRLKAEARRLRQPFGAARQQFNQHLARRRAQQLQHVHLAQLFARMGYTESAARQVRVVPVASARILCDLYCRMTAAHRDLTQGRLEEAAGAADELEDLLHRGIECGALVDPWNILGFDSQFSLFPAPENSVHDHRVDELIHLISEIFGLYGQIEKEAAAAGNAALREAVSGRLGKLAEWWDQYASVEVGSVEGISGRETRESADHVAAALGAWHEAGSAGDLAFWREHVEQFRSPKAYAVVVEALLQQRDPVAAMALLIQWLSRAEQVPLIEENYAFQDFALDWMENLWRIDAPPDAPPMTRQRRWTLTRKFFDYLEANAEEYWEVPRFELAGEQAEEKEPGDEEDDLDDLFSAAYEGVTYRDSTDDGFEGEMLEGGGETDFELMLEAERIVKRLGFLTMLAQLWRLAAMASMPGEEPGPDEADGDRDDVLAAWLRQATANRRQLQQLLVAVHRYRIPAPRGTHEALVEYDQRRGVKETLLEQVIAAVVETADAASMIRAAVEREAGEEETDDWQRPAGAVLRALMRGDAAGVRRRWRELLERASRQPLLYVALARGGNPRRIVASRILQALLRRLLAWLPRLGLLQETYRLIETVQDMEIDHPVGHGAITEFDQMFEIGCKAIVRCLVASSEDWHGTAVEELRASDLELIEYLEKTAEALLRCWLAHSRGVRLSVLETVNSNKRWGEVKRFIERYGGDLFTQQFMNLGNLRAILHQGVDRWLESLAEEPDADDELLLMREFRGRLSPEDAAAQLGLILEAVAENYPEYVDYNSTTTQSDRGEMLYTLLDFLRLRAQYDRVAWNLQPVVLAHEVLMRCGRDEAAEIWRQAVAERTTEIADDHLKRLDRLTGRYAMRLPSVAERLGERYTRPLTIDRLRALVLPTIDEPDERGKAEAFARLEEEIAQFTAEPSGAGFDVPPWLDALEQEVDRIHSQVSEEDESPGPYLSLSQVRLSLQEVDKQVKAMGGKA